MAAPGLVLYNCDVRPMDRAGRRAEAVAYREGSIVAVGTRQEVELAAGPDAEQCDGGGRTVLPGFVDAHHHPSIVALYGGATELSPPGVTDIASLQRTLSRAAARLGPGEWLVATGWDELALAERRPPTRAELDDAVGDRPLFALHYSYHRALGNSRALELAGVGRSTPDPSGGRISRGRGRLPDGLLVERAMSPLEARARQSLVARDAEGFFTRLARHYQDLVARGITCVVDATVPGDLAALYREAARRGSFCVPTVMLPVSTTGYLEAPGDALDGPCSGTEEGLLRVGPVKLVFDGAPGCAMCLGWWQMAGVMVRSLALAVRRGSADVLRHALAVEPRLGRHIETGIQIYRREEARATVREAVARGFAVATHAIGNAAVALALDAYEAAGARLGHAGVPRLEHATFLDRELCARIAGVGAMVVAQPHFTSLPAFGAAPAIPGLATMPHRWLLDAGVEVAGSSDHPVAGFDPLDGVRSAVTRRTPAGHVLEPEQSIELDEALALYTRASARAAGCLDRAGTLEPGKRADLVLLDRALDRAALAGAKVSATVLGGRLVYGELPARG